MKDQEGHKIYWASGNRVLDTFSTIQYMTICCYCHVNVIMPSRSVIWLEVSNLRVAPSKVTKTSLRTPDPLVHICEGLGMRLLPNALSCSWSLHPNCVLNLNLKHCMFAYSQTGTTSSLSLPCSSLSQNPLCRPSFHDYFLFWGTVCVKLLHRQTSISLMLVLSNF